MNKEFLSKQKYIHRIYSSSDKVMHCEKYPIIYISSTYCYYKINGVASLYYCSTKLIEDEYNSPMDLKVALFGNYNQFFFKVNNFNSLEVTNSIFKREKELVLKDKKDRLQELHDEYEQKIKEYETLKKLIEKEYDVIYNI